MGDLVILIIKGCCVLQSNWAHVGPLSFRFLYILATPLLSLMRTVTAVDSRVSQNLFDCSEAATYPDCVKAN